MRARVGLSADSMKGIRRYCGSFQEEKRRRRRCVGVTADLSQDRRPIITHSEREKIINSARTHTHTHTHTIQTATSRPGCFIVVLFWSVNTTRSHKQTPWQPPDP
ncbi:unnamed protein product [Leuciscus chuanchicus]